MSKFVAFFMVLGLFSASVGQAQTLDDKDIQTLKAIALELSYHSFLELRLLRTRCVRDQVMSDAFKIALASVAAKAIGETAAIRSVITGITDAEAAAQIRWYRNADELGRRLNVPVSRGKFLRKASWLGLTAAGIDVLYYLVTGNNLFTEQEIHRLYEKVFGSNTESTRASYYLTETGFEEFLNLNSENDIKAMFVANPKLMLSVAMAGKLTLLSSCQVLKDLDPRFGSSLPALPKEPIEKKSSDQIIKGQEL